MIAAVPTFVWTSEMDTKIRRMRSAGIGSTAIAKEIGTTRNAVIGRHWRLDRGDVAAPKVVLTVDEKVIARFNDGRTCESIAMSLKLSRHRVRRIVADCGIDPHCPPDPDAEISTVWDMDEDERRAEFANRASVNAGTTLSLQRGGAPA